MKTNTKFFVSLIILIAAVLVILKKPDLFSSVEEGMYTNISLFVLIVVAFFTGIFFERRGKGEERPLSRVSPQQYSQQSFPGFEQQAYPPQLRYPQQYPQPTQQQPVQQQPIQQLPPNYQPIEKAYTKPIDKVPSKFPDLDELKK